MVFAEELVVSSACLSLVEEVNASELEEDGATSQRRRAEGQSVFQEKQTAAHPGPGSSVVSLCLLRHLLSSPSPSAHRSALTWARAGLPALGSVLLSDSSSDSSRPRAARRPGTGSPSRPPLPATERPGRRVPGILGLLTRASLLRLKGRSSTSERRADDGVRRTETLHLLSGRPAGEGVVVLGRRAAKKLQDTKVDLRGQLDDPLRKSLGDLEAPR
ncbi:hypothetical protein GN956_G23173 [Arapaima gigas]